MRARNETKKAELNEQLKEVINDWRKNRAKEEEELQKVVIYKILKKENTPKTILAERASSKKKRDKSWTRAQTCWAEERRRRKNSQGRSREKSKRNWGEKTKIRRSRKEETGNVTDTKTEDERWRISRFEEGTRRSNAKVCVRVVVNK